MALEKKTTSRKIIASKTSRATSSRTTTRSRKTSPKEEMMTSPVMPSYDTRASSEMDKRNRNIMKAALGIIVIAVVLYLCRGLFLVAIVNGQPIWRYSLDRQLEQQGGKQVLDTDETKILIEQEAKNKNITVSQADLAAAQKQIEASLAAQGQTLDSALAARSMSKSDFMDQLRLQKLIEKLLAKDLVVTDQDINTYLATNKDLLPQGMTDAQASQSARDQIIQQKIQTEFPTYLTSLQKKSKIISIVNF